MEKVENVKLEIRTFGDVDATKVVIRNTKLYVNREEGFYWYLFTS